MEDQDIDPSSLWFQPPASYRRRSSSPIINPVILIILLPILVLLIVFFLLPPLLSYTSIILRQNSVKKSWDSLNVILVVFAILCGVFARRNDEASSSTPNVPNSSAQIDNNRQMFQSPARQPVTGTSLRRSSSSYPDLRQESLWETGDNRFRFYDDFELNYRSPARRPESFDLRRSEIHSDVKEIVIDTFVEKKPASDLKRRRSFRTISKQEKVEKRVKSDSEFQSHNQRRNQDVVGKQEKTEKRSRSSSENQSQNQTRNEDLVQSAPAPPPPPPPLPPPPVAAKLQKKKSNAKEIATAISSLYKRKRKQKTTNIYDHASVGSTPPPPPPPPPPPSAFYNMFKKTTKNKKVHSILNPIPRSSSNSPPVPPPPPPPGSIFNNLFKSGTKSKRFHSATTTTTPPPPPPPPKQGTKSKRVQSSPKPPLPRRVREYNNVEDSVIPVPPPLPPFKIPEMKFVRRGDFVKVASNQSSRAVSPEPEVTVLKPRPVVENDQKPVGPSVGGPFCPSPDVNTKADNFIARLRGEWKLEKMNSVREKQKIGQTPASPSNWGQI